MRLLASILFSLALLLSCSKENYLQLSASESLKSFIPDYSNSRSFASNNGDTISIRKISQSNTFERLSPENTPGGSLPDYDYIEVEKSKLVIGSDSPYTRFSFELNTSYNPTSRTRKDDLLQLSFEEESGLTGTVIDLAYQDSVICANTRCQYQDTLRVQNNTFFDVYFTPRDSLTINALYLNESSGLIGFRTSDNRIFELIP